jgi:hypothetical protein
MQSILSVLRCAMVAACQVAVPGTDYRARMRR